MTDLRTAAQQALEALENCSSEYGYRCNRCDSEVDEGGKVASALRAALAQPVPHGCHVDLDDDMEPDGCVLDEGSPRKCVHADRLLREGKDKTACEYWKPIEVKR
jgi:hypothetical protein